MSKDRSFMGGTMFAIIVGTTYLAVGLLWLLAALGFMQPLFPGGMDAISAIAICVIAIVFLSGFRPLSRGEKEGFAFMTVGIVLALVLFILQLFIMGANFLGWVLGFEDWAEWTVLTDLTPNIWLFLIVLLLGSIGRRFFESPWIFDMGGLSYA